ncbi:MAG: ABC transporter substrate-binding protein [Candidatus Firestonebacteria bacterium]
MRKIIILIIVIINFISCTNRIVVRDEIKEQQYKSVPQIDVKSLDLKVGFIASLSDEQSEYSKKIKNGIETAIEKFNLKYNLNISLEISDIKSLEKIAKDDKTIAVIGPVFNANVSEISKLANELKLPVITPSASSLEEIPDNSYFFENIISPFDEGRVMAEYAVLECKKNKLAIIHSNSSYSNYCADSFAKTVKELGGEIIKIEKFEDGTYDFKEQMLSLGGIDPHIIKDILEADKQNLESLLSKLVLHVKTLIGKNKSSKIVLLLFKNIGKENLVLREELNFGEIIAKKLSYGLAKVKEIEVIEMTKVYNFIKEQSSKKEEICRNFDADIYIAGSVIEKYPLTYTVNIKIENVFNNKITNISFDYGVSDRPIVNPLELQAIYIPVNDSTSAEVIISHLLFYDLRVLFLGNSEWQNEKFLRTSKSNLEGSFFTVPYFLQSNLPLVSEFTEFYKSKYFEEPDYLAASGYDTCNLILELITQGARNKEDIKNKLLNLKDFFNVAGKTYFKDGKLRKDLHILSIKDGDIVEIR